jgi:thiol-disulfide isomerase/thioredoxin
MLVFVAHWCPHCQAEVPRLVDWHAAGDTPEGLDVIGVSTAVDDSRDNYPPSDWLAEEGWPWPVLADDENSSVLQSYGFGPFPAFVLLNPDGTVALRFTGEVSMEDLDQVLNQVLGV